RRRDRGTPGGVAGSEADVLSDGTRRVGRQSRPERPAPAGARPDARWPGDREDPRRRGGEERRGMADRPLLPILTPSFNQGRFSRATIESGLAQRSPHIEYLGMDGGSTDETVKILQEYDDRLTWVSERDGGQAEAINKGWRRARGSVLAYLNSDDTYLPDAV